MKERPILFSSQMVRALLDGSKTQTRRILKMPAGHHFHSLCRASARHDNTEPYHLQAIVIRDGTNSGTWIRCPYSDGSKGDQLWVRESMRKAPLPNFLTGEPTNAQGCAYVADGEFACDDNGFDFAWKWKRDSLPSIHMLRAFSRINLIVEAVRVERVQDISEEDARAEGCDGTGHVGYIPTMIRMGACRYDFANLWMAINGEDSWDANPWVWVVTFSVIP